MSIKSIANASGKFVADNSPTILTALGVTGLVTTAFLTGKASFRAAELVRLEQDRHNLEEKSHPLDLKEKAQLTWKLYIPAAGVGVISCAAIIGANRIGTRRAAAVTAAYAITEKAFTEYREKVIEKIGANKEQAVRDEIAQDRVNRSHEKVVMVTPGDGKVLCHDAFSNQFFHSDMETIRRAQNDINAQILHSDFATVSDFYHAIGSPELETTSVSGEMGWNTDKLLDISYSTVLHKGSTPCLSIDFAVVPIREPWRFC